ncbi:autophagy-related protein 16-1 [Caerostris extrusa]|uniref:Autophagy-related protein 16-1 n=1 Tax=Caerostris extrusa TaxID=172846 RepID=A0AAV4XCP1_CAEEX|nr:autophagy-related protein 16-1 [Caerostris extrusa]
MNLPENSPKVMENSYKQTVLQLLKARNSKEQDSFEGPIKYANKLYEKLDYLQKTNAQKNFHAFVSEQNSSNVPDQSGDSALKASFDSLQKTLGESQAKNSKLIEQVFDLKEELESKNSLVAKQSAELEKTQSELKTSQDLCKSLKLDLTYVKNELQRMSDELNVLNISYSVIENQRNKLEIENKEFKSQLMKYNEEREGLLRMESLKNFLEVENKKLHSQIAMLMEVKEHSSSIEDEKNDLEIENSKLKSQIAVLREARELSLKSGSSESICSIDGSNTRKVSRTVKAETSSNTTTAPSAKASHTHSEVPFPDKKKFSFVAHDSEVNAVMWYPDPSYLLTAGSDRRLKLWEICESDVKLLTSARDCNSSILSIDIDCKASSVLCASSDFSCRLWDISDFKLGHTLTGHSGKVMSAKFVKESDNIITGSLDKTVKLWVKNKTLCTQTFSTQSPVHDIASRDSNTIISGHLDRKIRFWDIRTKTCTNMIETSGALTSLDVSKNLLLASEHHGKLKLYDLRTLKELMSFCGTNFKIACSWTRARFSSNRKYCCCGSENGSVFIWNCVTGALERELKGHDSSVIACNWSVCNSYLATCDSNRKCVVWCKQK